MTALRIPRILAAALALAPVLELSGCRCDTSDDHELESSSSTSSSSSTDAAATSAGPTSDDDGTETTGSEGDSAPAESSTGTVEGGCQGTDTCDGTFCVAPYADNVRGPFQCVDACVGPGDEARWCFDDAACCDPAATCTIRGYCEVTDTSSESSTDTSSGTTSTSTDTSGG